MTGGFKASGDAWQWVTGEPFAYSHFVWRNGNGQEMIQFFSGGCGWDGTGFCGGACGGNYAYLVEWSADCNGDGIVDYGQIRSGDLADANSNGVPDCCDQGVPCPGHCPADIVRDGQVNGEDLAAVLSQWGTPGASPSDADIDSSGLVDGKDLATVLSAWGPCP